MAFKIIYHIFSKMVFLTSNLSKTKIKRRKKRRRRPVPVLSEKVDFFWMPVPVLSEKVDFFFDFFCLGLGLGLSTISPSPLFTGFDPVLGDLKNPDLSQTRI